MFGWLLKLFGRAAAPLAGEVLDEVAREANDYLDKLREESRPVPLPYSAIEHQRKQERAGAHAFPPTCPESLPPSAPPAAPPEPWHQASVEYPPVTLPLTPLPVRPLPPRPLGRASSGPPPRMSPPPALPAPDPPYPSPRPGLPRPPRRRQ